MGDLLVLMAPPFVASVVLVGIHAYLGMHVVTRGVIFVDLALAQFSAVGAAVALVLGHELESRVGHGLGSLFALAGAVLFALVRPRRRDIPHEALIGIAYAVASAATILVLDRAPHGAELVKSLLVGSILWVSWGEVGRLALTYGLLGAVLWRFHPRLLAASRAAAGAEAGERAERAPVGWDLLFYGVFALVVTSSVPIAGVLLVFTFLIVPTLFALVTAGSPGRRLLIAWSFGVVVNMIGCLLSYSLDLPTGAAMVCAFGGALVVGVLALGAARRRSPR